MRARITGNLVGQRRSGQSADIVHVQHSSEQGPAENSFVLVCGSGRARYLSWIGYYDVEYAARREPGDWALVEPAQAYEREAEWLPYGWEGARGVPTIGDAVLANERVAAR